VPLQGLRLLLVDDERDTLELFTQVLARAGAVIETAVSAEEAIMRLEQRCPDVLLCDIGMPHEMAIRSSVTCAR